MSSSLRQTFRIKNPLNKYFALLFAVYIYIFGVLLNYDNAWMHPEIVAITQSILSEHTTTIERLGQWLNWDLIDGTTEPPRVSRARFLSYLVLVANIVLRNWLFHFVPPHPSLSVTWLFALFLTPFFLYRLVLNLLRDKETALISTIMYLSLPGSLIPIIMLFHPGKVFTNFFFVFCLYLASRIHIKIEQKEAGNFIKEFLVLVATIFLSLFFDEYSLFIFVLVPLFFPGIFSKKLRFTVPAYLLIPFGYAVTVIYFLPWLYNQLGFPGFNVLEFARINKEIPAFSLYNSFINFILLLHDNLVAGINVYLKNDQISVSIVDYWSLSNHLVNADNIRFGLTLLNDKHVSAPEVLHNALWAGILVLALFSFLKRKNSSDDASLNVYILKSFLSLVLFSMFFSLLHILNFILSGCAWYGCSFSVLFALFMGFLLTKTARASRPAKYITFVFLCSLVIQALYNTRVLNTTWLLANDYILTTSWRRQNNMESFTQLDIWLNKIPRKSLTEHYWREKEGDVFQKTYAVWQQQDPEVVVGLLNQMPPNSAHYLAVERSHLDIPSRP